MASAGNVQYSAVSTTQPEEQEQGPPPYDEKLEAPPQFDPNIPATKPLVQQQQQQPQHNVIPQQQQQQQIVSNTQPPPPPPTDTSVPSGEGIMGEPFKRMLCIGCILILYYILAFWMPVYWMSGAANYCQFFCNTYPPNSVSTSTGTIGGCYESTDPSCDDQCDQFCDSAPEETVDSWYEQLYKASSRGTRLAAWTLIVIGMIFGFIGCITGIVSLKKNIRISAQIASVSIGLGGLMIIIGALIFVASWDVPVTDPPSILSTHEDALNAVLALVFIEYAFPSIIAILLAIDVWQPSIFNDKNTRMLAFSIPFAIFGIMGGVIWAYIVNYDEYGFEFEKTFDELYDSGGCAAAGYFIFGLMAVATILIWREYVTIADYEKIVKLIIMILICIGGFILCVGYWAFIDAIFQCEYSFVSESYVCKNVMILYFMTSDPVGPSMAVSYDIPYQGQFQSYYVGYTLFIVFITAVFIYDLGIIEYCKQCKSGANNTAQNQSNNQETNQLKNTSNQ